MAKYLLSYDEQDVKNGNLDVSPDGVLRSAGKSATERPVIYLFYNSTTNKFDSKAFADRECTTQYDGDALIEALMNGAYGEVIGAEGASMVVFSLGFIAMNGVVNAVFMNIESGSAPIIVQSRSNK
jgi:hypothetical protein